MFLYSLSALQFSLIQQALTNYTEIQKWWELVMCAYLMVCLHNEPFNPLVSPVPENYQQHSLWDSGKGWKNALNNLQLILQPFICFNLILRWLKVFPISQLSLGFPRLICKLNDFDCLRYLVYFWMTFVILLPRLTEESYS